MSYIINRTKCCYVLIDKTQSRVLISIECNTIEQFCEKFVCAYMTKDLYVAYLVDYMTFMARTQKEDVFPKTNSFIDIVKWMIIFFNNKKPFFEINKNENNYS